MITSLPGSRRATNGAHTCSSTELPMHIRRIEMRELRMELLTPFETSFGVTRERRIVVLKVIDGAHSGFGEVTAGEGPFYSHETYETAWHVLRDFIIPSVLGKHLETPQDLGPFIQGIR